MLAEVPMPSPQDKQGLEVFILQQISESLTKTNEALASLDGKVDDIGLKVNSLETLDLNSRLAAYEARLSALEHAETKVSGVKEFFGWIARQLPWLVSFGSLAYAFTHRK